MNKKIIIIIVAVILIVIAGVWYAFQKPLHTTTQDGSYTGPLFSDLRLGTPVRESFATQKNPPIKQKSDYTEKELIMLQATTMDGVKSPVTVTVRLVDELQNITPLIPEQVTLDPGTNEYCCWNIPTAGQYNVQVIRPDGIITNLPIKITPALGQ